MKKGAFVLKINRKTSSALQKQERNDEAQNTLNEMIKNFNVVSFPPWMLLLMCKSFKMSRI